MSLTSSSKASNRNIGVQSLKLSVPAAAPRGLTSNEARRLLDQLGANAIAEKVAPAWRAYLVKFWSPIAWLLEAAMIVEIGLGKYVEAAVIAALLRIVRHNVLPVVLPGIEIRASGSLNLPAARTNFVWHNSRQTKNGPCRSLILAV